MAADLPKEFDVVVLGTGVPESIVAAAFSRIGQSVLHLDRNVFYSGDWASFSLKAIETWVEDNQAQGGSKKEDTLTRPSVEETSLQEEGETLVQLPLYNSSFSQVEAKFFAREEEASEETGSGDGVCQATAELAKVTIEQDAVEEPAVKQDGNTEGTTGADKKDLGQTVKAEDTVTETHKEVKAEDTVTETHKEVKDDVKQDADITEATTVKNTTNIEGADKEDLGPTVKAGDTVAETHNVVKAETCEKVKADVCDTSAVKQIETVPDDEAKAEEKDEKDSKATKVESVKSLEDSGAASIKQKKVWTVNTLKSEWRKFNIDLSPKLLFSGGDMVELLISSDIAKYCEFKTVTRILTVLNDKLEVVPCSRAGVFSSKTLSMLEKRMLMKFLQFCAEYQSKQEELTDFMDKPFTEFLGSKKLSATVKHYIQHSIAMATSATTTRQGLSQMKKFLMSLGRYGNTSFLWSLYGSGELPQSFCRMCAVFGGIYCLRMSAASLIVDSENKCTGVITTEGQRIKCKWLIMESSYAPADFLSGTLEKTMSRAVIMTDSPLLPSGQHELSQMCLPCPDDGNRPVFLLELPPSCLSSPTGVYIYHLTRQGKGGVAPKDDLSYAVDLLFKHDEDSEEAKPRVLWSLYFSQRDTSQVEASDKLPSNVVLMSGPGMEIDVDRPVQEAKAVFQRILPDEEFLPKAPNPEDIVYIDDAETKVTDGNTQSEFTDSDTHTEDSQSDTKTDEKTDIQSTEQNETSNNQSKEQDEGTDNRSLEQNEKTDQSNTHDEKTEKQSPEQNKKMDNQGTERGEVGDQSKSINVEDSGDKSKVDKNVEEQSNQSVINEKEKKDNEQKD